MKPLLALILVLAAPLARAIVDVHSEYYTEPDLPVFAAVGASYDYASGDKDESNVAADAHLLFRPGNWNLLATGELERGTTNDERTDDASFVHLRAVRHVENNPHGFEVFYQYGDDRFAALTSRRLFGAGYRFEWKEGSASQRGLLGAGLLRERETFESVIEEDEATRANLYATFATPIAGNDDNVFAFSAYYQPNIDELDDYRAVAFASLTFFLNKHLSVDLETRYSYNTTPAPGRERRNTEFTTGFTYRFPL